MMVVTLEARSYAEFQYKLFHPTSTKFLLSHKAVYSFQHDNPHFYSTMHHGRMKEESIKELRLFSLEKIPGRPHNCLKNKALLAGPQDKGQQF